MDYAPIVLFVYNRADHFVKVFEALSKCEEAKYSDLYIYSDGPRNAKEAQNVNQVRQSIAQIINSDRFKSINVIESNVNKGLAASVISGVSEVIKMYGKIIVIEDDCVPSPYFLNYINSALEFFESNKEIGSISGYSPKLNLPDDYMEDIFLAYRSCSWTWATWLDRWEGVDWYLNDIKDFYNSPSLLKKLNSNGNDRFIRLYRQTKGNGSSWSVRFGAHLAKNDLYTVYPRYSYTQNIGCDESGVHSTSKDAIKMHIDIDKAIVSPVFKNVQINNNIQKIFKKHYSYGFISDFKKIVATVLIVLKEKFKG